MITCIGQRIQAAMEKKEGLKQAHLAKMTNINPRRLQLIIRDELRPSMTEIQRISRVLSVKVSYLLAGVEESPPSETAPNPELVELLKDPDLQLSFRRLGNLDDKEQTDLVKIIEDLLKKREALQSDRGGK
ncbi:MAG: helix-turn-helix transcriptional regulator [Candidatus Poribacteria bacterium]|nr:helix-turn-helix transcriptional regulator [Candidatus Poribacteria bacterium]